MGAVSEVTESRSSDHRHYHRVRRHGTKDVDGEDCGLLLLSLRDFLFCPSRGKYESRNVMEE